MSGRSIKPKRVFVDTNVIIEAFRVGCWKGLCKNCSVETVEKVVQEALAGDPTARNYVVVDKDELLNTLSAVHPVDDLMRARFSLAIERPEALDAGEADLLAFLYSQGPGFDSCLILSTADMAAISAAGEINLLDNMEALQVLAKQFGISNEQVANIRRQFSKEWLAGIKIQVVMGVRH